MLIDPSDVPVIGAFYQHRSSLYIAQVVGLDIHLTVGYLVWIRTFHGPYARRITLNPYVFAKIFSHVPR